MPRPLPFGALLASGLLAAVAGARQGAVISDDPGQVGAASCGACHAAEHADWAATAHARAWDTLPPDRRGDARCTGCHTAGAAPRLRGVQCEACHGLGSVHPSAKRLRRAAGKRRAPFMAVDPAVCLRCHTADAPKAFDPGSALRRVDHSGGRTEP